MSLYIITLAHDIYVAVITDWQTKHVHEVFSFTR